MLVGGGGGWLAILPGVLRGKEDGPLVNELFGVLKQIQNKTSASVIFLRQIKIFVLLLFFKITFFVLKNNNIFSLDMSKMMFYLLYSILCRVYS